MGQQKLLLLTLGALVVGFAIANGVNQFDIGMISSNKDAIRRDILLMLSQAKAWYQKSEKLGGGGRSFDQFTGFMDLGYESENEPAAANVFINENGTFVLEKVNDGILITGRLVSDPGKEVKYSLLVDPHSNEIRIEEASPAH